MQKYDNLAKIHIKIPPYINSLSGFDQIRYYTKLLHKRKTIGVLQNNEEFLESLRTFKKLSEKYLNGEYDYDILSNESYRNMFNFVPLELREFKTTKLDMDVTLTTDKFAVDDKYLIRRKIDENDCIFHILSMGSNTYIDK